MSTSGKTNAPKVTPFAESDHLLKDLDFAWHNNPNQTHCWGLNALGFRVPGGLILGYIEIVTLSSSVFGSNLVKLVCLDFLQLILVFVLTTGYMSNVFAIDIYN